jgi:hypothetical protein
VLDHDVRHPVGIEEFLHVGHGHGGLLGLNAAQGWVRTDDGAIGPDPRKNKRAS